MAQLAIKGHPTRGKEVIKLLEMLGGVNNYFKLDGMNENFIYYICPEHNNDIISAIIPTNQIVYTLEEFLEEFPYKVGDKVRSARKNDIIGKITNALWDNNEEQIIYVVKWNDTINSTLLCFARGLQPYKEETMEEKENSVVVNIEHKQLKVHSLRFDKTQLMINDEYELKQEGDAYYIVRKKKEYPKTFEECCEIMQVARSTIWFEYDDISSISNEGDEYEKRIENTLLVLRKLIICRDAYWKIAGEKIGLCKSWEPDWTKADKRKYCVVNTGGNIAKWVQKTTNKIFAFPSEEMIDAFYENFKELIETVKELL